MQTTLLGLAIALILALATALLGPLVVDWSRYRGEFEARASRLTGLDFHVTGAIDARLLPTPTLVMQGIEIARPDDLGKLRARALRIEFGLGALVRGEWRITDARLEGPGIRRRPRCHRAHGLVGAEGQLQAGRCFNRTPAHPRWPRSFRGRGKRLALSRSRSWNSEASCGH